MTNKIFTDEEGNKWEAAEGKLLGANYCLITPTKPPPMPELLVGYVVTANSSKQYIVRLEIHFDVSERLAVWMAVSTFSFDRSSIKIEDITHVYDRDRRLLWSRNS